MTAILYAASPLETFLSNKAVNAETTAVFVQDLTTGKVLAAHNKDKSLLPASIMKTVTIAALLNEAGPDERFHTRIFADGPVDGNRVRGDLVVVGGGDPTLGADCLPESADIAEQLVAALRHHGIEKIEGTMRIDTSLYSGPACPPTWVAEDRREAYGTGSHALNFRRNAAGGRAVKEPVSLFANHIVRSLASVGISLHGVPEIGGDAYAPSEESLLLVDHVSDRYAEVMRSCMMRSDNLFAENLLRTFALARGNEGSTAAGAEEMMKYWKNNGVDTKG